MKVYHLTIRENGHSRRFVFEDRDEALKRLADATAAGLDAKLDEVVRAPALRSQPRGCPTRSCPFATTEDRSHGAREAAILRPGLTGATSSALVALHRS